PRVAPAQRGFRLDCFGRRIDGYDPGWMRLGVGAVAAALADPASHHDLEHGAAQRGAGLLNLCSQRVLVRPRHAEPLATSGEAPQGRIETAPLAVAPRSRFENAVAVVEAAVVQGDRAPQILRRLTVNERGDGHASAPAPSA